jgi:hypothetical protein
MQRVFKIARGALVMGLTWAAAWGGVIGGGIELLANIIPDLAFARWADIWIFELGIPGFFTGAAFSLLLSLSERSRSFEQLSLGRFAALGAAAGLIFTGLLATMSLGSTTLPNLLARATLISIPVAALGAATSSSVLLLARLRDRSSFRLGAPKV